MRRRSSIRTTMNSSELRGKGMIDLLWMFIVCCSVTVASDPAPFPSIEVSGMSISQSIDAPMTTRDTVTMSGSLSSHNGVGNGEQINSKLKRFLTNLYFSRWIYHFRSTAHQQGMASVGYRCGQRASARTERLTDVDSYDIFQWRSHVKLPTKRNYSRIGWQ